MILPEIINQHLKEYSIEKNEGETILFWQPHNENLSVKFLEDIIDKNDLNQINNHYFIPPSKNFKNELNNWIQFCKDNPMVDYLCVKCGEVKSVRSYKNYATEPILKDSCPICESDMKLEE